MYLYLEVNILFFFFFFRSSASCNWTIQIGSLEIIIIIQGLTSIQNCSWPDNFVMLISAMTMFMLHSVAKLFYLILLFKNGNSFMLVWLAKTVLSAPYPSSLPYHMRSCPWFQSISIWVLDECVASYWLSICLYVSTEKKKKDIYYRTLKYNTLKQDVF